MKLVTCGKCAAWISGTCKRHPSATSIKTGATNGCFDGIPKNGYDYSYKVPESNEALEKTLDDLAAQNWEFVCATRHWNGAVAFIHRKEKP